MSDHATKASPRSPDWTLDRRAFLRISGLLAATLALPHTQAEVIAEALAAGQRLPVVWLEFQDCTGDSESFIKATAQRDPIQSSVTDPGITDILLDVISVEYHETLMAPAGAFAERSRDDVLRQYAGQYVVVIEGSIPAAQNGIFCTVGGRTALSIAREVCSQARAVIALGACAVDGGLAAAAPNPTGAIGVRQAVPGLGTFAALPGCPANVVNLTATLVYLLTYGRFPESDGVGRPRFAYHEEIHEECERHDYYEDDKFVRAWGDEGHRKGWCLRLMGCRGPNTDHNCPTVRWNSGTCWPVAAGHGCIGCASSNFWDRQAPFYQRHGGDDDDD